MNSVTKKFHFCAAHRLYPYKDKCSNIHGHNYTVEVTLSGKLKNGMVLDFTKFSKLENWIDLYLDHALIVAEHDPLISTIKTLALKFTSINGSPTAENIAKLIYNQCTELYSMETYITVWETEKCKASYTK